MIGQTVSHYEILEPLGAGGMGVVYKGHDRRLDRFVALKFLPAHLGLDAEVRRRFVNEARAASALDHANICTIYAIDETAEGQPFIVMALYEGESLKDAIARGPLPPKTVIDWGLQIAAGLAAAHGQGILHRDIKPANVFVTRRGEVKILDFGLAKVVGATKLTQTGTSMGTLNYMSPEQLRGEAVDTRADVWALGALLYEMLTGSVAFGGDNEGAVVYSILEGAPPLVGLPGGVAALLSRCLAKRVGDRPPAVEEVRRQLESMRSSVQAAEEQPTLAYRDAALETPTGTAGIEPSVAVVDFTNITGDPSADWLSGGIAETLSVDLNKLSSIKVVGRRQVHGTLGSVDVSSLGEEELELLGRNLGARWLFWGGFQKLGDAIRLTAHSFDVAAGATVETVKLDGTMTEIFALQDEILKCLIGSLDLELSASEALEIERPETEDLEAYEYCAKARELVYRMEPAAMAEAAGYLQRAIELDPDYALAYSSLGQLYSMRFIATTDPEDLSRAIENLQRAVLLDPELGDPHGWLAYAYARDGRYAAAIASGRRAVDLEADNPQSHYFLAVALWLRSLDRFEMEGLEEALTRLRSVTRLVPRYQPGHQIQAGIYLQHGRYEKAWDCLVRAVEIEESGRFELGMFVGAIGLAGRVAFRQGRPDQATELFDQAFAVSGESVHVYTPACNALAHCWRGDLLLSQRRRDDALRSFREAQEQIDLSPRSLGIGWALLRSQVGLATCFHLLGMRRESVASYDRAVSLLATKRGYDFSGIWDGGDAQIHFELACFLALSHRLEESMETLERAIGSGWREAPRLDSEPVLEALRNESRFRQIRAALAALPPLG